MVRVPGDVPPAVRVYIFGPFSLTKGIPFGNFIPSEDMPLGNCGPRKVKF